MKKRGQGLSTNAIVLIIMAVIILVILVLGFFMGWEKLAPWFGSDNVDTLSNSCQTACLQSNKYAFCEKTRELKAEGLPEGVKSVEGTCQFFSTDEEYAKYGIESCPGLC